MYPLPSLACASLCGSVCYDSMLPARMMRGATQRMATSLAFAIIAVHVAGADEGTRETAV